MGLNSELYTPVCYPLRYGPKSMQSAEIAYYVLMYFLCFMCLVDNNAMEWLNQWKEHKGKGLRGLHLAYEHHIRQAKEQRHCII